MKAVVQGTAKLTDEKMVAKLLRIEALLEQEIRRLRAQSR
jgi:hypothetical protein